MATKEDILEQLVEEYLIHKGYFVQHNIKFKPRRNHPKYVQKEDSNDSDIDVLGYHPDLNGPERVWAVTCKSWQGGFNGASVLEAIDHDKRIAGRAAWKNFRELTCPKWASSFRRAVWNASKSTDFTYVLAVTRYTGNPITWEMHPPFIEALQGNPIKVLTVRHVFQEIGQVVGTTLAASEVGRLLQILRAGGIAPQMD